jgi:ArsR family transcriptional regulator
MSNDTMSEIEQFADIFGVLSNPNRLRIFARLVSSCQPGISYTSTKGEVRQCIGDLGKGLDIVPSTVSHHLKEMHRVGLIRRKRRGQNVECWVDRETLDTLVRFFEYLSRRDFSFAVDTDLKKGLAT